MTPDAAGIVAQVDAALLIALTIDARLPSSEKSPKSNKTDEKYQAPRSRAARLYVLGICSVLVSLFLTITSVEYSKPLNGFAHYVAINTLVLGFAPLIFGAIKRLNPEMREGLETAIVLLAIAMLCTWFLIWNFLNGSVLG